MPFQLDDFDVLIIKALLKDGRKSFRQISRETGITTPTVTARFDRLMKIGFVKAVSPIFDFKKVDCTNNPELSNIKQAKLVKGLTSHNSKHMSNLAIIKEGLKIKLNCDFCGGPIAAKLHTLKFASYERFFCCIACKSDYKEKYGGRIKSIEERYGKIKKEELRDLLPGIKQVPRLP